MNSEQLTVNDWSQMLGWLGGRQCILHCSARNLAGKKFYITYVPNRNLRRQISVTVNYQNAATGSLKTEPGLDVPPYGKAAKMFENLCLSLLDITAVTILRLEYVSGSLGICADEVTGYPATKALAYTTCRRLRESELIHDEHLLGCVHKVHTKDSKVFTLKKIPNPSSIDEFLYEMHVLHMLHDAEHVINLEGLEISDDETHIKGLLMTYAPGGDLYKLLAEQNDTPSERERRLKHGRQILTGLYRIHQHRLIHGALSLKTILLDKRGNAMICGMNWRGFIVRDSEVPGLRKICWSPQQFLSDIYDCGRVLLALALGVNQPDYLLDWKRTLRTLTDAGEVPRWFTNIILIATAEDSNQRESAECLLGRFPNDEDL